jgi:hypothetical protein
MAHHIFDLFGERPIASKKRVGFPFFFFLHLEAHLSTKVSHNNANRIQPLFVLQTTDCLALKVDASQNCR